MSLKPAASQLSENYDAAHNSMIHCDFLLVPHSGSQNKKKPVVGYHNRLFRCFEGMLHSGGQMVVKKRVRKIQKLKISGISSLADFCHVFFYRLVDRFVHS